MIKYSDQLIDWLVGLGYTHCFAVAGGNIMHLMESASRKMSCVAVVHEVAAGIAAEYFNETATSGRAFALVTAGPGMTNVVTAMAGAFLESRELLVLGGQVKTADLSRGLLRQRGIQEIDGVAIAQPVCVKSVLLDQVVDQATFVDLAESGSSGRKGPVFIEIPLDIQGRSVEPTPLHAAPVPAAHPVPSPSAADLDVLRQHLSQAARPVLLVGGGVSRLTAAAAADGLERLGVPVMTTWNGADRISADHPLYFGRPNAWGQRYSNILIQQSDLVIALGTRLGMQQTGFNWQEFAPLAKIVQVECDQAELEKGHPRLDWGIQGDANAVLAFLAALPAVDCRDWADFCRMVKARLPLREECNQTAEGYVSPYDFAMSLGDLCKADDVVIPCSSGGAFTVMMQTFRQQAGQVMVTNKGLASMGYGLSGAIGAAMGGQGRRTILVEGDGGFAQNLQEIGTVAVNQLNVKMFLFDNNGYASIRMTQTNYFGGRYVCCDQATGLGMPDWARLFDAYGVPVMVVGPGDMEKPAFRQLFDAPGPAAFVVRIDPEQSYFPKISSRTTASGGMESNPLHLMSPFLSEDVMAAVCPHLKD